MEATRKRRKKAFWTVFKKEKSVGVYAVSQFGRLPFISRISGCCFQLRDTNIDVFTLLLG
jgi:hypothetical protein